MRRLAETFSLLLLSGVSLAAFVLVLSPRLRDHFAPATHRTTATPSAVDRGGGHDLYGDPLPQAAACRLGTLRWRQPRPLRALALAEDSSLLASTSFDQSVTLWDRATGLPLRRLGPVSHDLFAVALDQEHHRVTAGGWSGKIYLWDHTTGRELGELEGHAERLVTATHRHLAAHLGLEDIPYVGYVTQLLFIPGSDLLASAGGDGKLRIWDLTRSTLRSDRPAHVGPVTSLAVTSDGRRLASTGNDGRIRVWDTRSGQRLMQFRHDVFPALAATFSPNGRYLAALCYAQEPEAPGINVWDTRGGNLVIRLKLLDAPRTTFRLIDDGRHTRLVTIDATARRTTWELSRGQTLSTDQLTREDPATPDAGRSSQFPGPPPSLLSPDGRQLFVAPRQAIDVYSLAAPPASTSPQPAANSAATANVAPAPRPAHSGRVLAAAWLGENRLASLAENGAIRGWDATTGQHLWHFQLENLWPIDPQIACDDTTGNLTVLSCESQPDASDGVPFAIWLRTIDPSDGRCLAVERLDVSRFTTEPPTPFARLATGRRLYLATRITNASLASPVSLLTFDLYPTQLAGQLRLPDTVALGALAASSTGRTVVAGLDPTRTQQLDAFYSLTLCDFSPSTNSSPLGQAESPLLALSPDGRLLATATAASAIQLLDLPSGNLRAQLPPPSGRDTPPASLAFSPNSQHLAIGALDGTLALVDVPRSAYLARVHSHDAALAALAWSADGNFLATGGHDTTLLIWPLANLLTHTPTHNSNPQHD